MIFRFAENKGLTFAYAELLAAGIPCSAITAFFEESTAIPRPVAEHQSFLQHLHAWFLEIGKTKQADESMEDKVEPPASPVFHKDGGTLQIKNVGREAEIIAIAVHHYGEMVG